MLVNRYVVRLSYICFLLIFYSLILLNVMSLDYGFVFKLNKKGQIRIHNSKGQALNDLKGLVFLVAMRVLLLFVTST